MQAYRHSVRQAARMLIRRSGERSRRTSPPMAIQRQASSQDFRFPIFPESDMGM